MKPLKVLLTEEMLEDLATRSHFRFGKKIAEAGDVKILKVNPFNIVAKVQHGEGEMRTVELMSTPKGFRHRCTCSSRKDLFCQHCVAVGLFSVKL
jgi:uncharacterized Zn finger protein